VTPVVGAGITVAVKLRQFDKPVLRRAYVTSTGGVRWSEGRGDSIQWRSGSRTGEVFENDEGIEWIHGHGPQARAALLVARGLG
jgi:hypothetical protein